MADQEIGPHPERLEQPEQSDLELEQRALRTIRPRQLLLVEIDQRRIELEARERLTQLAPHPRPLRPLAREHERRLPGPHTPLDERLPDQRRAVLELRPARGEREGRVVQIHVVRGEVRTKALDLS